MPRGSERGLPVLHARPKLVVDNAQRRHFHNLAFVHSFDAGNALTGSGVFDVGRPVPLDAADIKRVIENTSTAVELAADRGVAPLPTFRPGHAVGI